jgi:2-methylcitrate dehydratase
VEYPIGHRRRRAEGIPLLLEKFERNVRGQLTSRRAETLVELCSDEASLAATPLTQFVEATTA